MLDGFTTSQHTHTHTLPDSEQKPFPFTRLFLLLFLFFPFLSAIFFPVTHLCLYLSHKLSFYDFCPSFCHFSFLLFCLSCIIAVICRFTLFSHSCPCLLYCTVYTSLCCYPHTHFVLICCIFPCFITACSFVCPSYSLFPSSYNLLFALLRLFPALFHPLLFVNSFNHPTFTTSIIPHAQYTLLLHLVGKMYFLFIYSSCFPPGTVCWFTLVPSLDQCACFALSVSHCLHFTSDEMGAERRPANCGSGLQQYFDKANSKPGEGK